MWHSAQSKHYLKILPLRDDLGCKHEEVSESLQKDGSYGFDQDEVVRGGQFLQRCTASNRKGFSGTFACII